MTKQSDLSPQEQLSNYFKERHRLYLKGGNNERLNEKIRVLQKETNYEIIDELGKEQKTKL